MRNKEGLWSQHSRLKQYCNKLYQVISIVRVEKIEIENIYFIKIATLNLYILLVDSSIHINVYGV